MVIIFGYYYFYYYLSNLKKYIMKKVLYLFVVVLALSCAKKRDTIANNESKKFDEINQMTSASAKSIAFEGLSASEKASFWRRHLSSLIPTLSSTQANAIMPIYKKMTAAVFTKSSQEYEVFKNLIVPEWLVENTPILGREFISNTFYFLENNAYENIVLNSNSSDLYSGAPIEGELIDPLYDESAPDCICNIGSSWTCKKKSLTVSIPPSYTVTYGICTHNTTTKCDRDDYGCGYAGLWSCNGNTCTF
jgi:hypothetical protein